MANPHDERRKAERRKGIPGGTAEDRGAGTAEARLEDVMREFRNYAINNDIPPVRIRQMVLLSIYAYTAFGEKADADLVTTVRFR